MVIFFSGTSLSVGLKSDHLLSCSVSHVGPVFHSKLLISSDGEIPLETRSAGLLRDDTCFHSDRSTFSCMAAILFAINVFN